jgi:outer-membrane receptor for ferric coprogen and ferric-rhodotorulic acid
MKKIKSVLVAFGGIALSVNLYAEAETSELEAIVVEGEPGVVTEGTKSYTSERATVGFKHPVDLKEVPLTVNVITEQRLLDVNANTIEEAAYLLPNVTTTLGNDFSGSLYSRGHEVFSYNVDGAPRPYLSLYGTAPDMVFFDRIEVLSGPSGIFQGSGEPVGTINLVRKRAAYDFSAEGAAEYGSFDSKRLQSDITGSLNSDGSIRGRLISYGLDEESFVDISERLRYGGYGTLEFDINDSALFSIGFMTEFQDATGMSGQPRFTDGSPIALERDSFIGAPWNKNNYDTKEAFVEFENRFENAGVLKLAARVYSRDTDIKTAILTNTGGVAGVNKTTGNFTMFTFARDWVEKNKYYDASYTQPFTLFGKNAEFTVGADIRNSIQDFKQNFDFSLGVQNINTFNPYALVEPTVTFPGVGPGFRLNTTTDIDEKGGYGFGRVDLTGKLKFTAGGRYSDYDSETRDTGRGTLTFIDESEFIPFVGLSYDFNKSYTAYTSYSEIFQPQSETKSDGSQLQPIIGKQIEVGLKASFLDDKLNGQIATYLLDDEHRATTDPTNTNFSIESGELSTYGFEAGISGKLTRNIDIATGYSYVDTDLTTDPTPEHNFTAFGKYTFHEGTVRGLSAGLGVIAASNFSTLDTTNSVEVKAGSYAVLNALLGYEINKNINLQLNVNNLLDEDYIVRVIDNNRGTFYGEPLNAVVRLNIKFD